MIGKTLGSYRIEGELGKGGMGVVYAGSHAELGFRVAVKLLRPELSNDGELVQRFINEAKAAGQIRHPGIVQIYDFGRDERGAAWFAMERLEGESLRDRLRGGRALPAGRAATLARLTASVLAAAHAQGIVHRDLKPDNLFLVPDADLPGGTRVKVLDFGIAKLTGDMHTPSLRTRTGDVMGTPYYMSPEQCRGGGEVDARADVYALGCILFEMVAGRPPFVGEGMGHILGMHQYEAAPALSGFARDAPPALVMLVGRMLAKTPGERPQSMAEVMKALEGLSEGPVTAGMAAAAAQGKADVVDSMAATVTPVWATAPTETPASNKPSTSTSTSTSAPPIPMPAVPRRSRARLWVGIGALCVAGAAVGLWQGGKGGEGGAGKKVVAASTGKAGVLLAKARWDDAEACHPLLELEVDDAEGMVILLAGVSREWRRDGSRALLTLEQDELPDRLVLTGVRGQQTLKAELELPERFLALKPVVAGEPMWEGELSPGKRRVTGAVVDGELRIQFERCGITGGKASHGKVTINPTRLIASFPVIEILGYEPRIEVEQHFDLTLLRAGEYRLAGHFVNPRAAIEDWLGDVERRPWKGAPAFVGTEAPTLILFQSWVDDALMAGGVLRGVTLVAYATESNAPVGKCGKVERSRTDVDVVVREVGTGREVGRKKFRGPTPSCPEQLLPKHATCPSASSAQP